MKYEVSRGQPHPTPVRQNERKVIHNVLHSSHIICLSIARITQMEIVVACIDSCSGFKDGATCKGVCTDRGIIGQVSKALSTGLEYRANSMGEASISRWTENTEMPNEWEPSKVDG